MSESEGDFQTTSGDSGKVRYIIHAILYEDQIKHLQGIGKWPAAFAEAGTAENTGSSAEDSLADAMSEMRMSSVPETEPRASAVADDTGSDGDSEEQEEADMSGVFVNRNRASMFIESDSDDSDSDSD